MNIIAYTIILWTSSSIIWSFLQITAGEDYKRSVLAKPHRVKEAGNKVKKQEVRHKPGLTLDTTLRHELD